eukprot:g16397.t1
MELPKSEAFDQDESFEQHWRDADREDRKQRQMFDFHKDLVHVLASHRDLLRSPPGPAGPLWDVSKRRVRAACRALVKDATTTSSNAAEQEDGAADQLEDLNLSDCCDQLLQAPFDALCDQDADDGAAKIHRQSSGTIQLMPADTDLLSLLEQFPETLGALEEQEPQLVESLRTDREKVYKLQEVPARSPDESRGSNYLASAEPNSTREQSRSMTRRSCCADEPSDGGGTKAQKVATPLQCSTTLKDCSVLRGGGGRGGAGRDSGSCESYGSIQYGTAEDRETLLTAEAASPHVLQAGPGGKTGPSREKRLPAVDEEEIAEQAAGGSSIQFEGLEVVNDVSLHSKERRQRSRAHSASGGQVETHRQGDSIAPDERKNEMSRSEFLDACEIPDSSQVVGELDETDMSLLARASLTDVRQKLLELTSKLRALGRPDAVAESSNARKQSQEKAASVSSSILSKKSHNSVGFLEEDSASYIGGVSSNSSMRLVDDDSASFAAAVVGAQPPRVVERSRGILGSPPKKKQTQLVPVQAGSGDMVLGGSSCSGRYDFAPTERPAAHDAFNLDHKEAPRPKHVLPPGTKLKQTEMTTGEESSTAAARGQADRSVKVVVAAQVQGFGVAATQTRRPLLRSSALPSHSPETIVKKRAETSSTTDAAKSSNASKVSATTSKSSIDFCEMNSGVEAACAGEAGGSGGGGTKTNVATNTVKRAPFRVMPRSAPAPKPVIKVIVVPRQEHPPRTRNIRSNANAQPKSSGAEDSVRTPGAAPRTDPAADRSHAPGRRSGEGNVREAAVVQIEVEPAVPRADTEPCSEVINITKSRENEEGVEVDADAGATPTAGSPCDGRANRANTSAQMSLSRIIAEQLDFSISQGKSLDGAAQVPNKLS